MEPEGFPSYHILGIIVEASLSEVVPMTVAVQEKVEGIQKILKIWDRISRRLPSTYPKPSLVIHEFSLEDYFFTFYECSEKEKKYPPGAFCDPTTNTVHVQIDLADLTAINIASYLLHEVGHLRAYQRYGEHDPRANDKENNRIDERYANTFASRWIRKLCSEGWF